MNLVPGQGNNAYIFPGLGLGLLVSGAERITDELFSVAAHTLARLVTEADLEWGRIFPALARIRDVSAEIAFDVASEVYRLKLTGEEPPSDLRKAIHDAMFEPVYSDYTCG